MRLTLDLDNITRKAAQKIYDFFGELHSFNDTELWRSASGKGYHLIVWNMSRWHVKIYRQLFDDPKRLKLDNRFPNKPQQVLFTNKKGKHAKRIL